MKFETEKKLCDYLERHLSKFCAEVLEGELDHYKRESYIVPGKRFGANKPQIDFDIYLKSGQRCLIECKNPSQVFSEATKAISQLLIYGTMAGNNPRLIMVTSGTLPIIQDTILNYDLPIEVCLMRPNLTATWSKDWEQKLNSGAKQVGATYAIS